MPVSGYTSSSAGPTPGKSNILGSLGLLSFPYYGQRNILQEFVRFENSSDLFYDGGLDNTFVVLCPKLEDWTLDAARAVGIRVGDHNPPNSSRGLLAALDAAQSERLDTLKQLLTKDS